MSTVPFPLRKKLSAIIACYRDEQAIPVMAERLRAVFQRLEVDYEIIFVNDGSPDNSQLALAQLTRNDYRIKVITHSRNFGSQNAFTSGMKRASGDACVLLDGDLQDPPELISDFYQKWREGYEVVYGVRQKREMPRGWEILYKLFYRILQKIAYISVPVDAGDFSLIDQKVVDVLNSLPERDRFLRGLRAWAGFRQAGIPYLRPERMFGRSTNNLWSNLRWARRGIFSFSYLPLEAISTLAGLLSIFSIGLMCFQFVYRLFTPHLPAGVPTIVIIVLLLGSAQLMATAFLAEYVGRIFEEVKGRPQFVVAHTLNLDPKAEAADPTQRVATGAP